MSTDAPSTGGALIMSPNGQKRSFDGDLERLIDNLTVHILRPPAYDPRKGDRRGWFDLSRVVVKQLSNLREQRGLVEWLHDEIGSAGSYAPHDLVLFAVPGDHDDRHRR